jgi:Ser/Thr protein kinase RdoA (MazF antagonist)
VIFTKEVVEDYLQFYKIGRLNRMSILDSGFESDNVKIATEEGIYVMRVIYQTPNRVFDTMKIYDLLVANDIKTAKPIKTRKGEYYIEINSTETLVIQEFINGQPYWREDLAKNSAFYQKMLKLYGRELGKVHKVSSIIFDNVKFREIDPRNSTIQDIIKMNPSFLRMSEHSYVQSEYRKWVREAHKVLKCELSFGVSHDDIKPGDFFLINDELSGILDFNAARFDFLVSDIAAMVMYCDMYQKENLIRFQSFIVPYLENSCVRLEELRFLQFFFKTRGFLQIFYFKYRIETHTLQGVNSEEDNLKGFRDGIEFLKAANKLSSDYFYDSAIMAITNQ